MNRRIPSWIALVASGVLFAGAAMAQGQGGAGGDNPQPSGSATVNQAQSGAPDASASTQRGAKHMKGKRARHARHTSSTSTSGTRAAGSFDRSMDSALSQCANKTDRQERADCVRSAWESKHGTS